MEHPVRYIETAVDQVPPLSDAVIATPPAPHVTPSSLSVAIKATTAIDRNRMFIEGRHTDLFNSMAKEERL